jgi:hypothetical protein
MEEDERSLRAYLEEFCAAGSRGATAAEADGEHLADLVFRFLLDSGILWRRSLRPRGDRGSAGEFGGMLSSGARWVRHRRRGLERYRQYGTFAKDPLINNRDPNIFIYPPNLDRDS